MSVDTTYSFSNLKRDLSEVFATINTMQHNLLSVVPIAPAAHHVKHEWLEDTLEPISDALNGLIDEDDTPITVDDGSKFAVGMILRFEGYAEQMLITSITGHDLTVTRGYGDTSGEAMVDNTVLYVLYNPKAEGTEAGYEAVTEPSTQYNYTQIFARTAKISNTAKAVGHFGIDDVIDRAVWINLQMIQHEINNGIIFGQRYAHATDATVPRNMGGLLWYLSQVGTHATDASAADISLDLLNNLIESIAKDGGRPDILLMNTVQARKLSALNRTDGTEYILRTEQSETKLGNYVREFISDLPMGFISKIVVDTSFPQDKIALLSSDQMALVPLAGRAMSDFDASPAGADYTARRVIGEYTLEFRNNLNSHGLLYNLDDTIGA